MAPPVLRQRQGDLEDAIVEFGLRRLHIRDVVGQRNDTLEMAVAALGAVEAFATLLNGWLQRMMTPVNRTMPGSSQSPKPLRFSVK